MLEMHSNAAYFACIIWVAFSFFLFLLRPFRNALLLSLCTGTMFLPIFSVTFLGVPDLNKMTVIIFSLSAFCLVWELRGLVKRPKFSIHKLDILVLFYIFIYIISAYSNNLGLYEGFCGVFERMVLIGVPYLIGRLYFSNITSHTLITKIYLYCTFIYLPFIIFELRFSPQLHRIIYGYHQHSFGQTLRAEIWRPVVFMRHGLEVALWLSLATLIGIWLIRARIITKGLTTIAISSLGIITIIGQSWGAIILLIIGVTTLVSCHFFKMGLPFVLLFIFPTLYVTNRICDFQIEKPLIEVARSFIPLRRFRSLTFRVDQEYKLVDRANEKPFFGWGRFGGNRIIDSDGIDRSITDSRWIIEYGQGGLSSMLPFLLIFTIPVIGLYRIAPASLWHTKNFAPSAALAVGTAAVLNDLMLNSFFSPIHLLIAGALAYPQIDQTIYKFRATTVNTYSKEESSETKPDPN